jgi:GTP-binding protein EngB required for normal cell division
VTTLNDNHKAKLLASLQYLDELLGTSLDKLERSDHFLFPPYVADVSPEQHKLLGDYLAQLRQAMRRFLDAQEMSPAHRRIGAAWALHVTLTSAQVALDELRPDKLRGYGELSAEGEQEIAALLAGLRAILVQMDACLVPQGDADIGARLSRLGTTSREAERLRAIAEIAARYGLVEFRPTLLWLLERMEEPGLEVAFFGRVSSGKSSLINWLLEADVLPTGVTPVTTVPTRIVAGKTPQAHIHFTGKQPATIELARLREFVSEQGNPDNAKKVARVTVEFPSRRLHQGVCLVDTPGLGSLATAGAAQTLSYLPRCDVAVLLVDAAAGLGAEDIAVARSLQSAGADTMAVLSRADLLAAADRETMLDYLRAKFHDKLGTVVPVWPVSVLGESRALAERWMEEALVPRLNRQRELAAASMRRKTDGLRDAVTTTLEQLAAAPRQRGHDAEHAAVERETGAARAAIEAARSAVRHWGDKRRERVDAWLAAAAEAVAQGWAASATALPEAVAAALDSAMRDWTDGLADELAAVHAGIAQSLATLERSLPEARMLSELPRPSGQPLFDVSGLMRGMVLQRGIIGMLGSGARQHLAREQLQQQLAAPLEQALSFHEHALRAWGMDYLAQLERAFSAAASPVEAGLRTADKMQDTAALARDIAQLKSA